ncbi:bifunctional biotin--[acetyl-CoA-carboxylase] ligase/biotin operon repressor BirA [Parendozoicomonas sp. Alg238-R29]|uniref:bifunctional biotin--[acetyl-CoA-carboxylase] ligase/biotin operon repressor BirA n=1 Tax=Parendozoicomonas sp. Alg238-R29 TaxID=2993446 RepID=UPI00248DF9E4|nr:bifunctional biotin--[acetyl-CoA-carboxylase] ligase/biotin operon repressor BirA [Parendozoicomonas sp. Alg238-R29]
MENLIRLLGDGRFHSGEELGSALGVSRAAVWKKLKALSDLGLELDAVRGKGYRLPSGVELLDRSRIDKEIPDKIKDDVAIDLRMLTSSTNDDVRSIEGDARWRVCMAEYQSGGRGRRGRVWQSPFGASLYFSMLWNVESGLAAMEGLSLAVGLTVLKTLESSGVSGLTLKWPNDVLMDGRKLAGVLLEISGDPTGSCEVVIGVGINLVLGPEQKKKIDQPVTDVKTAAGMSISKNKIAGRLIANLSSMLSTFQGYGFAPYREQWSQYDAFAGRPVVLYIGANTIAGISVGVNDSGAVLIKNDAGTSSYAGGEISLREL